ncbi:molybdopterin molybdotransferase MoeA [Dactylosporangium sp. NPDC005572]|uniref:molybdopterin molybdotransferase MoeA n=1 Tax=Dactylosporangium sp. NPDC005572 TaxID=3156889 RepID=UPI0033A10CCD
MTGPADIVTATADHQPGHLAAHRPMPWHQARTLAHQLAVPLPAEVVALPHAAGRTLRSALHAATMLPGFDNAAMDGYAVRGPGPWQLVGRVLAGDPATSPLALGEAVEIGTGAPVPDGTDRVVRYEDAVRDADTVFAPPTDRHHIRRHGEYVRAGQQILPAGYQLRPAALGLAASVGIDAVTVTTRALVQLLITGDEVIPCGRPPQGTVRDAIGPVVNALLPMWGADPDVGSLPVPDRPADALTAALIDSLASADVVVVCGASSIGPADSLHHALHTVGATVHVDGVACRPGHPQVLAEAAGRWIVGLPGNPFAALVAAHTLLQPLLAGLAGHALPALPTAPLHGDVHVVPGHTRLVPVHRRSDGVHVIGGARPGHLGPAAHADALAVLPAERGDNLVQYIPLTTGSW